MGDPQVAVLGTPAGFGYSGASVRRADGVRPNDGNRLSRMRGSRLISGRPGHEAAAKRADVTGRYPVDMYRMVFVSRHV